MRRLYWFFIRIGNPLRRLFFSKVEEIVWYRNQNRHLQECLSTSQRHARALEVQLEDWTPIVAQTLDLKEIANMRRS